MHFLSFMVLSNGYCEPLGHECNKYLRIFNQSLVIIQSTPHKKIGRIYLFPQHFIFIVVDEFFLQNNNDKIVILQVLFNF